MMRLRSGRSGRWRARRRRIEGSILWAVRRAMEGMKVGAYMAVRRRE